ncbi:EamA family transporter [Leucobacter allii]|uniref:EamA family transporter n=1 Tax=Leucobacter allii TaxID=2932247 RepID=UPI001FD3B8D8|nr:EamA family transporter [Leucobacter allii]UOR01306.1 EamA family transporter [Leucobacter allii]
MSQTAFLLVLAAAFAHAAWNIIAHGSSRSGLPFLWWGSLVSALLWAGAVPFTGGLGTADLGGFLLGAGVSALLHVGYMLLLQRGYAMGDLSLVYATARGTGPLLTVLVAVLALGERPAPIALAGIGVILLGIVGIGLAGRAPRGGAARGPGAVSAPAAPRPRAVPAVGDPPRSAGVPGRRGRLDPGLGYGLATGVAIAAYTVWDTHALRVWELSPVAFMVGCAALELPLLTVGVWRRRRELLPVLRTQWGRLLLFGVLSPLSYILVLTAVTIAPVALVAPVREVSVVLVSLWGAFVFRERRPAARIAASLVVVGGVLLLGAPS